MATIKIKKIGTPIGGEEEIVRPNSGNKGSLDDSILVRDMITGLVGGGFTSLKEDTAQKNFAQLRRLLGDSKANEIMTKVVIHNQDPRYKALPIEEKISSFYDQQQNDPVIGRVRKLSYGVLPGFRTSPNVQIQGLQNQMGLLTDPETVKSVGLKIRN